MLSTTLLVHEQAKIVSLKVGTVFFFVSPPVYPGIPLSPSVTELVFRRIGALDDGRHAIPPLFYPMLNKCLAVPVLADWARYLWENGRQRNLIALLNDGEGQGYAAWRVLPAADAWQEIVQAGL